jgi:ATP-dependent DNA ligase
MENYLKMSLTLNKNEQTTSKNVSNTQGQNENKANVTRGSIDSSKKLNQNTKPRYTNSYMQAHVKKQLYQEEQDNASRISLNKSNLSLNKSLGQSSSTSKILKGGNNSKMTTSMKNLKPNTLMKADPRRSVSTNQPMKKFIKKLSTSNLHLQRCAECAE